MTAATCGSDGTCTYTFTHAVPAGAKGTYAIGIEGRDAHHVVLPGTDGAATAQLQRPTTR